MIAEDELLVRVGLNVTVPWADFGMKVVAVEEDGISAWESYQSLRPNVVLTDIRMPGMDGVELIRRIRGSGELCAIIVITCLEEFDILYKLMQMDITGYLIKASMVRKDVTSVLNKAVQKLQEGDVSGKLASPSLDTAQAKNPLHDFIFLHHDRNRYLSDCKEMKQNIRQPKFCIIILWNQQLQSILVSSISNMFQKRLQLFGKVESFSSDEYLFISLTDTVEKNIDDLYDLIQELTQYVNDALNVELRISLCDTEENAVNTAQFVESGKKIVRNRYFYPDEITIFNTDFSSSDKSNLKYRIALLREKIFVTVPTLEYQKNKLLFQTFFDTLQESLYFNQLKYEESLISLGQLYFSTTVKTDSTKELLRSFRTSIAELKTATDSLCLFEQMTLKYSNSLHPIYGKQMVNTMLYISQHASDIITLADLSSFVNLSPNYYSTLFKQMLGCSFSDYIGLVRISKACDLMTSTTFSIQVISNLCGFSDATYFSRFFKQKIGLSPHQWRMER